MKTTTRKRILSILLTLALSLGLLALAPVTAHAAGPVNPTPTTTWNFTAVDTDGSGNYNDGSWTWVQATKTLTLTNISYTTTAATALRLPGDATIVLSGTNAITSTFSNNSPSFGILHNHGDFTITGGGSLNVRSGTDTSSSFGESTGIKCSSTTTDSDKTFTIRGGATVTAAGGTTNTSHCYSWGYCGQNLVIMPGSTLTATGYTEAISLHMIGASTTIPSGATYYVNTTTAPSTTPLAGDGLTTVFDSSHKYVKIVYPIALTAGSVSRTSDTAATINFTANMEGTAYYAVLDSGAAAPSAALVKSGGTSLSIVTAGAVTGKPVTLTAGAKDIYVVLEALGGLLSAPLKISVAAFGGGGGTDPGANYIKLWGKTTKYLSNFGNWLLVIFCFGWIWMAF